MDGYVTIKTSIDNKNFDAQIDHIEEQLKEIEYKLKQADMGYEVGDTLKLESQYERLNNQLIRLKKNQDDIARADLKNIHTSTEKASKGVEKLNNTMSKGIKRILRFSVAIIGVGSLFTILSKAFNSNEEAVKKMENVWKGLGAILQPVIDWISDKLMYGVAVVNEFIKALTGIDLVARANAKALDKQANAQKNLNKQTFSFDEMNIAQSNSSSSSNNSSGLLELPELSDETISKIHDVANSVLKIWDSTKGIRDVLKKIIDFALKHPGVVLAILGGAKLASWLPSIIGTLGGTAGLFGIATALTVIAGISIANVIDEVKELKKSFESSNKQANLNKNNFDKLTASVEQMTDVNERFVKSVQVNIGVMNNSALSASEYFAELKGLNFIIDQSLGTLDDFKNQLIQNLEVQESEVTYMDTLYEKTQKNKEQTSSYIEYLEKYRKSLYQVNENLSKNKAVSALMGDVIESNKNKISALDEKINYLNGTLQTNTDNMENLSDETNTSKNKIIELFNAISQLKDKAIKVTVDGDTSKLKNALNSIFDGPLLSPLKTVFKNFNPTPKLAAGGIVNNPGRGVPMGSYIAGEVNREGVLPLTDSNVMAQLGQEIGKWITVQNVSNTYLNGRLIQRQIDQAAKSKFFETNGW